MRAKPPRSIHQAAHQAIAELVFAGLFWGFGFVATVWALQEIGPFAVSTLRFGAAAAILLALVLCRKEWRRHLTGAQAGLAFLPGLFLALTLVFQIWGLRYTTATKSSFITTLYVLVVPALERWFLNRRLHRLHWLFAAIALVGTALICGFQAGDWNVGDLLTLACMLAASFQILWFGRIAARIDSAMTFNFWQIAWGFALCLPTLFFEPGALLPRGPLAWSGMASTILGSTVIAFALQIRAQKVLSPSVASLLYLLESPFATLFAIAILGERLAPSQWLGAGLILVSVAAAAWMSSQTGLGEPDPAPTRRV